MTDHLTQVGVGGIFVLLVLREVFGFISGKNGKAPVARCEFDEHKKSVQYRDNCEQIVKRMDGQFQDVKTDLHEIKQLIRDK